MEVIAAPEAAGPGNREAEQTDKKLKRFSSVSFVQKQKQKKKAQC